MLSSCASWNAAQSNCLDVNSNLTSVTSQEENTYIQHRHGGDTGWIGLQDIDSEGNFTWIDGTNVNFTYWAANQPNGYPGDQDCVHTLGLRHDYHWNDVTCGSCHAYTCKRDIDECSADYHMCDVNAQCINTEGSYTCTCKSGYTGDGRRCSDIDECSADYHMCDVNAKCINTDGSYTCTCKSGYPGDGRTCSDHKGLENSIILRDYGNNNYLQQLSSYLSPVLQDSSRSLWIRCWSAASDGWDVDSTFHPQCDNKGPTVTIVRVGSYIFGGYSDISWDIWFEMSNPDRINLSSLDLPSCIQHRVAKGLGLG
ncbi:Fibrillin-2 [Exaiptasia diaphana]|nr:Fibrillin-2 [Exaiptasia diaphana]